MLVESIDITSYIKTSLKLSILQKWEETRTDKESGLQLTSIIDSKKCVHALAR